MDTSRQTKEMGLWFMPASKMMKKLQKLCYVWQNCLSIRVHHLTVVQLESFWRDGEVSPALQHLFATPGLGQPRKSPVSLETSMISCKVWHLLTSEGTFFQITIEWRQACHMIIQCGKREWKEKTTEAALWISRRVWRDTAWEKGGKRKINHRALCLIPDEFVFFSLSPPSSTFTTSLLKGYTYHGQILSWYLSLFADLWILNFFHTDQTFPTVFSSVV